MYAVLPTDSSPWSAIRGSPELRAYSSMPRGGVPWPQLNGNGRGTAAARVGRRTGAAVPKTPNIAAAETQQTPPVANAGASVHLVDTCGLVVDMRPVLETGAPASTHASSPDDDDIDQPDGGGGGGNGRRRVTATGAPDSDRQNRTNALMTGSLSRVQEDLKHIPPGKLSVAGFFVSFFFFYFSVQ